MLSVQLLGQPQLLLNGQLHQMLRRKVRALVYYLAAHCTAVPREKVLAILWPDVDRSAAQHSLRSSLHEAHKILGDALGLHKDSLAIMPAIEVDARLFEGRLQSATTNIDLMATTLQLYRGDFLEGFSLPDSPEFDDWAATERDRYRSLAIGVLVALADQHTKRGSFGEALAALERALNLDPFREDVHRNCIHVHYLVGDRAGAIRRYEHLRKLLVREMGVPPMAETRALYDAIIADSPPLPGDHPRLPVPQPRLARMPLGVRTRDPALLPFVGRDPELRALSALVSSNEGRLVLVEGEPGIGKTRLVEELVHASGALAVTSVAHELEDSLPYQPIAEALRGLLTHPQWPELDAALQKTLAPVWRAEIEHLLPEMAGSSASDTRSRHGFGERRLWEAVANILLTISQERPVIVFLDDLHWADASTLGLLGHLVRRLAGRPVAFVAATHLYSPSSHLGTLVRALTRENRLTRFPLSRLEPDDMVSVAFQLCPGYGHVLGEWLARISEGSPYVMAELVRYARENGVLLANGVLDLNALSRAPSLPQTVYGLVGARLERLSETARGMVDAAAVIGHEFEFEVVARAADYSEKAALAGLDELQAAGLVRPLDGACYCFDHSLTVEVAYRAIGNVRREMLHRHVAEALEHLYHARLESIAGLLALHFGKGNASERAAPYALRAGRKAIRLAAWTEAEAFLRQALVTSHGVERVNTLLALGDVLFQSGRSVRGAAPDREAAAVARARGSTAMADIYLAAALIHQQGGFTEFLWGAEPLFKVDDLDEASSLLAAAAARHGDTPLVAYQIEVLQGIVAAQQGDIPQSVAYFRAALASAAKSEDQDVVRAQVCAHMNIAYHLHQLHDPDALPQALSGLRIAREKDMLGYQPYLYAILGEIALAGNDLENAGQYLAEGLTLAERLSVPYPIPRLMACLGRLAVTRGDTALAVERLSTAIARADALAMRHGAARIRLWLIPLLPVAEARHHLSELRAIAEQGGRDCLRDEIARLEAELLKPSTI